MPHPDAMTGDGTKDALVRLVGTALVPPDTTANYTVADFTKRFPAMLAGGRRVLKQNHGSTGEGIWLVSIDDPRPLTPAEAVPLGARVKCVEAVDNHVEHHTLAEFMRYCEQYIAGDHGPMRMCSAKSTVRAWVVPRTWSTAFSKR